AGHTIALSGVAVSIGFAALLLVPLNELRSVAVGGLVVVTVSVLLATTLLPGLLAWLGPRVDLGHVPRGPGRARAERWRRWGRWEVASLGAGVPASGRASHVHQRRPPRGAARRRAARERERGRAHPAGARAARARRGRLDRAPRNRGPSRRAAGVQRRL